MNNKTRLPELKEFCNALVMLAGLEAQLKKETVDQAFVHNVKQWSTGLFRLVVMGEVKKGKSSFINALLGVKDLVPVSSDIATSTIYKICYGENAVPKYKVFFSEASQKSAIEISGDALSEYGTEDGNPGNEKEVDFIQVFVRSPFLQDGLVIIDTPGLGGLFRQHKRITYEYVPRADAVFLVSDSVESPIGQAELDLLDDLKKVTDQIFFVQTKAASVGTEDCASRKRNNCSTLQAHGFDGEKLKYFVVDSHLKLRAEQKQDRELLAESGFPPLAAFVNNEIKPNVQLNLMKKAMLVARPKYEWLESHLLQMERICNAETQEQQNALKQGVEAAENDFSAWQKNLPMLQDKFQNGIRALKENAMNYIKECRPQGTRHQQLEQEIFSAEDMASLTALMGSISEGLANDFAKYQYEVGKGVQSGLESLLRELEDDNIAISRDVVPSAAVEVSTVAVNTSALDRVTAQCVEKDGFSFETARTGLYGGMAGSTMAFLVGGAIGSILPGIGTIIGSTAGLAIATAFGAHSAVKQKNEQELQGAKNQAGMALSQAFVSAYQSLAESVQKMLSDVERDTFNALKSVISARQNELKDQKEKIHARQTLSAHALKEEQGKLEQLKKTFSGIMQILKSVR